METERPPEEPHPDEPGGDGDQPSEGDYRDEDEVEEPLPGEEPEGATTPPEDLVDRAQSLIHDGLSKRDA